MNTSSFPRCVPNPFWWVPGFKNAILSRSVGFPSAGLRGGCSRPCSQGRENPRLCSPFLHASLCFLREACRTLPQPHCSWLSPSPGGCCALMSAWPLLWSSGSAAANRAAFINLPKCVQTLRGTSSPLLSLQWPELQLCKQWSVRHNAMQGSPE